MELHQDMTINVTIKNASFYYQIIIIISIKSDT